MLFVRPLVRPYVALVALALYTRKKSECRPLYKGCLVRGLWAAIAFGGKHLSRVQYPERVEQLLETMVQEAGAVP